MIGCRGEIYIINREKFVKTYEASEEAFDIYDKLPEYMPEVRLRDSDTYISLDEKAKLCYPKSGSVIYAKPLEYRTKVFSNENQGEYFVGKPGDYLALRADDLEVIYIIQTEIFEETLEPPKIATNGLSGLFTAFPKKSISFCIKYPTTAVSTYSVTPTLEQCAL